jgi:glutathione peroxidase
MSIHEFQVKKADGGEMSLSEYKGKVLLVVNTASACGFTPQYEGLQKLKTNFGDRGFEVLGFPCNQFGAQEPGSDSEIQGFCSRNYGVTFPVFSKIEVNGEGAHPLYQWLKKQAPGILGQVELHQVPGLERR